MACIGLYLGISVWNNLFSVRGTGLRLGFGLECRLGHWLQDILTFPRLDCQFFKVLLRVQILLLVKIPSEPFIKGSSLT